MSRRPLFATLVHVLGALIIATSAAYVHVALPFLNSPPITVADSYTVHGNAVLGLLLNDSDPDGDPIFFYDVVSPPAHGTVTVTASPLYRGFTAHQGYVGPDSFTYRISDNFGNISSTATVTINIVNNPPTAGNDSYTVHGSTVVGPLLANDSDPDGDSISFYDIVTWPTHGNLQP